MPKLVLDVGGRVLDCGLDYLRVTALEAELPIRDVLMHVRERQLSAERDGWKRSDINAQGFQGETCGGWRWGKRDGLMLFEASSDGAPHLLEVLKHYKLEANGTRVDCAVTYQRYFYDEQWPFDLRLMFREAEQLRGIKRPRRAAIIDHPTRGSTLELLSRFGRRFLRHYDKSAEQRHKIKPGTFRAEVEYKRELARLMYKKMLFATDQRMLSLDAVTEEWRRLGIDPDYDWKGQPIDLGLTRRPADEAVTEEWLIGVAAGAFHNKLGRDAQSRVMGAFFKDAPADLEIAQPAPRRKRAAISEPVPVPAQRPEAALVRAAAKARVKAAYKHEAWQRAQSIADRRQEDVERKSGL